jgi:hypothetical protein
MLRLFRSYSSKPQSLKARLKEIIPIKQAEVKQVRTAYGAKVLGNSTVDMVNHVKLTLGVWWNAWNQGNDLGNFSFGCRRRNKI